MLLLQKNSDIAKKYKVLFEYYLDFLDIIVNSNFFSKFEN